MLALCGKPELYIPCLSRLLYVVTDSKQALNSQFLFPCLETELQILLILVKCKFSVFIKGLVHPKTKLQSLSTHLHNRLFITG